MIQRIRGIVRGQRGFTLIELLAVMAILATLVSIVAPAVAGTREASIQAQAQQDGTQVRTAANKYFSAKNESETRVSHTVTTTSKLPTVAGQTADVATVGVVTSAVQVVSNRWPEKYVTTTDSAQSPAGYANVFQTAAGDVDTVVLLDAESKTIKGDTMLVGFTAIDIDTLVTQGYLAKKPAGVDLTSENKPNFLWLFTKTSSSSAAERKDDSRDVAVFKLVKVEKIEGTSNVKLTYQQILGSAS